MGKHEFSVNNSGSMPVEKPVESVNKCMHKWSEYSF